MKYKTLVVISLNNALVKLNEDQARRRAPFIEKSKEHKGFYEIKSTIQFKAGEEFETVEELPKVYWDKVERLDKAKKTDKSDPKSREALDAAIAELPGKYKDADYVVKQMRDHFGKLFTDADEKDVRSLIPKE